MHYPISFLHLEGLFCKRKTPLYLKWGHPYNVSTSCLSFFFLKLLPVVRASRLGADNARIKPDAEDECVPQQLSPISGEHRWGLEPGKHVGGEAISSTTPLPLPSRPPTTGINVEKVCSWSEGQRQEGHFQFFGSSCQTFSLISRQVCPEPAVAVWGHFRGCPPTIFDFFFLFALCWKPLSQKWVTQMSGAMQTFPPAEKKQAGFQF